jgi:hypothetical protein
MSLLLFFQNKESTRPKRNCLGYAGIDGRLYKLVKETVSDTQA